MVIFLNYKYLYFGVGLLLRQIFDMIHILRRNHFRFSSGETSDKKLTQKSFS